MAEKTISLEETRAILARAATGNYSHDELKLACVKALEILPKSFEGPTGEANFMVCSDCGAVIAQKDGGKFDIYDCAWKCEMCERLWRSCHNWVEIGNLLIPYGTA